MEGLRAWLLILKGRRPLEDGTWNGMESRCFVEFKCGRLVTIFQLCPLLKRRITGISNVVVGRGGVKDGK
jgi:hypothetical protein